MNRETSRHEFAVVLGDTMDKSVNERMMQVKGQLGNLGIASFRMDIVGGGSIIELEHGGTNFVGDREIADYIADLTEERQ